MTQDDLKALVGRAALDYVVPGEIVGVGTGSTVNRFIDALAPIASRIPGAVSSSTASTARLQAIGIPVKDLNDVGELELYVDGADEANRERHLIKGGGAALTREKIVADMSARFVCIADQSKLVDVLGRFPLPIEVIPMATALVARRIRALGGEPRVREGVVTDNGGRIIDVSGLSITDPGGMEREINQWPGVVCVGIFARNRADVCLLGTPSGVRTLTF